MEFIVHGLSTGIFAYWSLLYPGHLEQYLAHSRCSLNIWCMNECIWDLTLPFRVYSVEPKFGQFSWGSSCCSVCTLAHRYGFMNLSSYVATNWLLAHLFIFLFKFRIFLWGAFIFFLLIFCCLFNLTWPWTLEVLTDGTLGNLAALAIPWLLHL